MLGWNVSIYIPTEEQARNPADSSLYDRELTLAQWSTTSRLERLFELSRQGRAQEILSSGYPLRHTAPARDVLPLLADEALLGMNKYPHTRAYLHPGRIATCPEDQLLIIDAMDQS